MPQKKLEKRNIETRGIINYLGQYNIWILEKIVQSFGLSIGKMGKK